MRALKKDPQCPVVTLVCVQPSPAGSQRTFRPASSRGSVRPSDAASRTGNVTPSVSTMYLHIYTSTAASPATSSPAAPTATARRTAPGARTCCRSANVSSTWSRVWSDVSRVWSNEPRATCRRMSCVNFCGFNFSLYFPLDTVQQKVNNSELKSAYHEVFLLLSSSHNLTTKTRLVLINTNWC